MQLYCNGEFLDIPSGMSVQYKKQNPLFAFDSMTCERTTSFVIPDTPKNDRILSLSKDPAFRGTGMRRRFKASLCEGASGKEGYLYVTNYTPGAYHAIFVTGDLMPLQAIKDAGKIADLITCKDWVYWISTKVKNPTAATVGVWDIPRYYQDGEIAHPSVLVNELVKRVVNAKGYNVATLPTDTQKLRIITGKSRRMGLQTVTIGNVIMDGDQPNTSEPEDPYNQIDVSGVAGSVFGRQTGVVSCKRMNTTLYYLVEMIAPRQDIAIKIPEDWPYDRYIISFADYQETFLGDRSFKKTVTSTGKTPVTTRTGEELAGRTVKITKGTPFTFVTESEYSLITSASRTESWYFKAFSYTMQIQGDGDAVEGDALILQDHLPDVTFVELLKTIATLSGKILNCTSDGMITFDDCNYNSFGVIDLTDRLISTDDVARTFCDYAQKNRIVFDSDDTVFASDKLEADYMVDNDNIATEKVLQTIPFSEGNDEGGLVSLKAKNESDTLATVSNATHLNRVSVPQNQHIASLCAASTKTVATFRMDQLQFDKITPKTKVLVKGSQYVWTEATWSAGVAKLTLARIE